MVGDTFRFFISKLLKFTIKIIVKYSSLPISKIQTEYPLDQNFDWINPPLLTSVYSENSLRFSCCLLIYLSLMIWTHLSSSHPIQYPPIIQRVNILPEVLSIYACPQDFLLFQIPKYFSSVQEFLLSVYLFLSSQMSSWTLSFLSLAPLWMAVA